MTVGSAPYSLTAIACIEWTLSGNFVLRSDWGRLAVVVGVVRWRYGIQSEPRGADVEMSVALRAKAAQELGDGHDRRSRLGARGSQGEIEVLQRPFQREVSGVVASLHLGQLGQRGSRGQWTACDRIREDGVRNSEPLGQRAGFSSGLDLESEPGVEHQLQPAGSACRPEPERALAEGGEDSIDGVVRSIRTGSEDEKPAIASRFTAA